jgi:hypothetical protein
MKYPARETQREGGQPRGLSWLAVCGCVLGLWEGKERDVDSFIQLSNNL